MSETPTTYKFGVLEFDLNEHNETLLQREETFLNLGTLNDEFNFTHDPDLAEILSSYQSVLKMNNLMGNIPKQLESGSNLVDTIIETEDKQVQTLILTNKELTHAGYSYFFAIQKGRVKRNLMYFYYEDKDKPGKELWKQYIVSAIKKNITKFLEKQFKDLVKDKDKKVSEYKNKIELIQTFYPLVHLDTTGGAKKSKKNTRRKRRTRKTKKGRRTNKK